MTSGDVVRVLDDPSWGYGPIGHVFLMTSGWVKVALDEPVRASRTYDGAYFWFQESELEVVDVGKWEKATEDAA